MDRKEIVISNVTCSEQFTNYKKADGYKNLQLYLIEIVIVHAL